MALRVYFVLSLYTWALVLRCTSKCISLRLSLALIFIDSIVGCPLACPHILAFCEDGVNNKKRGVQPLFHTYASCPQSRTSTKPCDIMSSSLSLVGIRAKEIGEPLVPRCLALARCPKPCAHLAQKKRRLLRVSLNRFPGFIRLLW